ncbi:conserved exported hypothetical protein [Vibrio chagasii]|nr:conserved exported hypothetical protein [Vibrio chagasii]CAH7037378.1 conserved exported hypothetical protein [Vibrio chagasii]CAH7125684.1 conserved exported hypothetical protein [Vibrio chagasii]CAH7175847.1 conserved exported hypothetical protein [Vibrio chagasii]CAH7239267.1 conserved exported hypothetical protein [Vibrio chagasii]
MVLPGRFQKEIPVNKIIRYISSFSIGLFLSSVLTFTASAQVTTEGDICRNTDVVVAFFNGVNTTPSGANRAKEELKRIHGEKSVTGDSIQYEVFYNYTDGFEDFVETFEQRLLEQDHILEGRYELFFEIMRGDGPWWSSIIEAASSTAALYEAIGDKFRADTIQSLTSLMGNPPTTANYSEHQAKIDNWVLKGFKLLFVAHSQGNLFANAAYEYTTTKVNEDSVKVVHVAPASPSLNGEHTLADLDLVINGLRLVGSVPNITDNIPGYLFRPSGVNGSKDILGHGFIEIYINQKLDISNRVRTQINDALNTLTAPPAEASQGFFTAQLTWDGKGDADLHVTEPSGDHVYYSNKQGSSGYLDVDNTTAYGPEHYFSSCNPASLKTGLYSVSVANFSRANGRLATVQIDSTTNGALGTKSVTLGEATGPKPEYHLFNVLVTKNEETGKYTASIE